MFKIIFKLIAVAAAIGAAIVGLSFWSKNNSSEYIEIYSDEDDSF